MAPEMKTEERFEEIVKEAEGIIHETVKRFEHER